jgi:hypothetical protein
LISLYSIFSVPELTEAVAAALAVEVAEGGAGAVREEEKGTGQRREMFYYNVCGKEPHIIIFIFISMTVCVIVCV